MLEGEIIKRKAKEDLELEKQKEVERRIKQGKTREDFRKGNEELKEITLEQKKKEAEQLKRISEYALKKDRMEQLKKDKEAQKFEEKQQERQKLISRQ